ncbi:MAG: hypothetical protein ACRCUY_01895 [Thermoguttaceae bacterium]
MVTDIESRRDCCIFLTIVAKHTADLRRRLAKHTADLRRRLAKAHRLDVRRNNTSAILREDRFLNIF